jgi:hypothetical protein
MQKNHSGDVSDDIRKSRGKANPSISIKISDADAGVGDNMIQWVISKKLST